MEPKNKEFIITGKDGKKYTFSETQKYTGGGRFMSRLYSGREASDKEIFLKVPNKEAGMIGYYALENEISAYKILRKQKGIPGIIEDGEDEDLGRYLIMDKIESKNLLNILSDRTLSFPQAWNIFEQLALILHSYHTITYTTISEGKEIPVKGIIHSDISLENILIETNKENKSVVYLLDPGIARQNGAEFKYFLHSLTFQSGDVLLGEEARYTYDTSNESFRNKPNSPPETALPDTLAQPQIDIFMLGNLLYQMLVKKGTERGNLVSITKDGGGETIQVKQISNEFQGWPEEEFLKALFSTICNKESNRRPTSIKSIFQALETEEDKIAGIRNPELKKLRELKYTVPFFQYQKKMEVILAEEKKAKSLEEKAELYSRLNGLKKEVEEAKKQMSLY